jgi:CxxC motif-containing protein (DUF1111 family)
MGASLACVLLLITNGIGCDESCSPEPEFVGHGPIAPLISAPMGEPVPFASPVQLETFSRGKDVSLRRFSLADGLGPAFNVTFCGSCHEKPVTGGSAGFYRNFFLTGVLTEAGVFFPGRSAGEAGGVIRMFYYPPPHLAEDEIPEPARPHVPDETNVIAQRNPIPFFGVGLLAELSEAVILENSDPTDLDGDGVSGRPNYDQGFVGRFGRKAQTVSIEGFIRGPLFNHLGVTTDPLTNDQRRRLPVDSSDDSLQGAFRDFSRELLQWAQAAAPSAPLVDDDGATDPEMSTEDLFDLVSFSMLLAAPEIEPLNEQRLRGAAHFDTVGCATCHVPRLDGPRGPLPVYSDLLLHDMGEALADGLVQGEATGSEFRTQPLWGISATGPYLHDGRAFTIEEAILLHAGEAANARDQYAALAQDEQDDLNEFLLSLGGRSQMTEGLLPPNAAVPSVGEFGGPDREMTENEMEQFVQGRAFFDREFGMSDGLGSPRFNGDSCRACHFEPVIGGAGPRGVNVMRHGILTANGEFAVPATGTILHKSTMLLTSMNRPQEEANIFEHRNTPHLFGLGLLAEISDAEIESRADPDDTFNPDGISGRVSYVDGERVGRFGWKAQVPSLAEFVRDGIAAELGMTLPSEEGLSFGRIHDNDDIADPELPLSDAKDLLFFMEHLGPPPTPKPEDEELWEQGRAVFESLGCTACHVPRLEGLRDGFSAYTDLLLHEISAPTSVGIEDASANMYEFRTAPLWGLSQSQPYMHDGKADTIEEAILLHYGEGRASRISYQTSDVQDATALLYFLENL